jgi:hypothetical protein
MTHAYQYHGFDIAVTIETDFSWKGVRGASATAGYVAIVRISKAGSGVALFSPYALANHKASHLSAKSTRS